jgi:type I restriction-modification system DNA methylase subunit
LQSQVYTPRWVVEFLVHNSLGKMYLEMYPDSEIKELYKIANAPKVRVREPKPLHEIKLIDPASGSGNFLLYAFEFFYKLYQDQIDNFGADYDEEDIPKLIIQNNLYGVDLDDRAAQLAQLGLWIKAKQKNRNTTTLNFNVVSSDFYLPDFDFVYPIFKTGVTDTKQLSVIEEIWTDLQQAHKFGSLVKIEEKLNIKLHGVLEKQNKDNKTF